MIPLQADITNSESVKVAFIKVKGITDELYVIVHFAGVYLLDSLVEIERESFVQAFEVNLFGAFLINKTFFPLLPTPQICLPQIVFSERGLKGLHLR